MNTPIFRQGLAAPFGSAGEFAHLLGISNGSDTTNLEPTTLVTPGGRAFLNARAGSVPLFRPYATDSAPVASFTARCYTAARVP